MEKHEGDNNTIIMNKKSKTRPTSTLSNRGVLLILSSNHLGHSFVIDQPKTIIGRSKICDIKIDDPQVSKEHCAIIIDENGKFNIEDLNSTNSTYLNEKALKKKTHIIYGDRIIIGNTILRFYLEEKI